MVHLSLVVPAAEAAFFRELARLTREPANRDKAAPVSTQSTRSRLTKPQLQLAERWAARSGAKLRLDRPGLSISEVLARQIAYEIIAAGWPVGANLGTEQQLQERYEVSRGVLRAAIRVLRAQTIVAMRRGPAGGLIVAEPSLESGIVPAGLVLSSRHLTVDHMHETRRVLELHILNRCFDRFDEAAHAALKAHLLFETGLGETASSHDWQQFHFLLARLTGNPSLELFLEILLGMTRLQGSYYSARRRERVQVANELRQLHATIARALFSGDRERGVKALSRYLDAFTE
jgi:DNA-binding FadR family transcriptional regulator